MFSLKDVLKAVEANEKKEKKDALLNIAEQDMKWSLDDRTKPITHLQLTKYQLYWLMWRMRVHLRSYENFEWSEMKDVITQVLSMLEEEWNKCQPSTAAPIARETSPLTQAHHVDTV